MHDSADTPAVVAVQSVYGEDSRSPCSGNADIVRRSRGTETEGISADLGRLRQSRPTELASRFALGAFITGATGVIATLYGPALGGLFLAFPAILPASLTLVAHHQEQEKARHHVVGIVRGRQAAALDALGATLGAVGLAAFGFVVYRGSIVLGASLTLALATATTAASVMRLMRTRSHFPKASTALLLVDVINPCDFPGGRAFVRRNLPVARTIVKLVERAHKRRVPVIYVNDNLGRWRSDIDALVEACAQPDKPGAPIVDLLRPRSTDYVVLKTTFSGFYQTPLDTMLRLGGIRTVIIVGFSADNCVLFTAGDAYMREYRIVVPRNCVGAKSGDALRRALTSMRSVLDARTPTARGLRLSKSHL